jgi:transcriptional regulator with XRE-family HTH domain
VTHPKSHFWGSQVSYLEQAVETIGSRLKVVRGAVSQKDFADLLGVSRSTLVRYEGDEGAPDAEFLIALFEKHGVDPTWLLTGRGKASRHLASGDLLGQAAFRQQKVQDFLESPEARLIRVVVAGREFKVDPEEYRWVPLLNVRLSGGPGVALLTENIVAFNAYRKDWLRKRGLIDAVLSEATVTGSSMEPELRDGDKVLLNHSASGIVGGAIYALRQGEDLLVKYLQKLPGGRVQVISENSDAFPSYVLEPADFDSGECEIIGYVELQTRDLGGDLMSRIRIGPGAAQEEAQQQV